MDNVQNCDGYINMASSQTYRSPSYLPLKTWQLIETIMQALKF
jgi:hypothetical protein